MVSCYNCGGDHFARKCPSGHGDPRTNSHAYNFARAEKKFRYVSPSTKPRQLSEPMEIQQAIDSDTPMDSEIIESLRSLKF